MNSCKTDTWDWWATCRVRDWVCFSILWDRYLRLMSDLEFAIEYALVYFKTYNSEINERPGVHDWVCLSILYNRYMRFFYWYGVRDWVCLVSCETDTWDYWAIWSLRLSMLYLRLLSALEFVIEYALVSCETDTWDYWATRSSRLSML